MSTSLNIFADKLGKKDLENANVIREKMYDIFSDLNIEFDAFFNSDANYVELKGSFSTSDYVCGMKVRYYIGGKFLSGYEITKCREVNKKNISGKEDYALCRIFQGSVKEFIKMRNSEDLMTGRVFLNCENLDEFEVEI